MSEESDDAVSNVGALREACNEGRATLDHQITNLQKIDQKAIKVLRANILLSVSYLLHSPSSCGVR